MARAFLKVYFDFAERTKELNDNEKGRLLMAMLDYARTGELPDLKGNERFCFSMFKVDIDRDCANYAAKVRNGSKGGRPAQSGTSARLTSPLLCFILLIKITVSRGLT